MLFNDIQLTSVLCVLQNEDEKLDEHCVKEEEFGRMINVFGVERDRRTNELIWNNFLCLSKLGNISSEVLTAYHNAFQYTCQLKCGLITKETTIPPNNIKVVEFSKEYASTCLANIDFLNKVRETVLCHPKQEERLKLCEPSTDMPSWWIPGVHDKELLIAASK